MRYNQLFPLASSRSARLSMWEAENPTRRAQPLLRVIKQKRILLYFCILNFNIPISYILTFG